MEEAIAALQAIPTDEEGKSDLGLLTGENGLAKCAEFHAMDLAISGVQGLGLTICATCERVCAVARNSLTCLTYPTVRTRPPTDDSLLKRRKHTYARKGQPAYSFSLDAPPPPSIPCHSSICSHRSRTPCAP